MFDNITKDTVLVKQIIGGGFTTEALVNLEEVTDNAIFIEGADGDYDNASVYGYHKESGNAFQNYIPAFRAKLVRVATEDDFNNEDIEQL